MPSPSLVETIRSSSRPTDFSSLTAQVRQHLDTNFPDLDHLLNHAGPSSSRPPSSDGPRSRSQRKARSLQDEIANWEQKEAAAEKELAITGDLLPKLLEETQEKLQIFLSDAQGLSIQRYALADKLAGLVGELSSERVDSHEQEEGEQETIMEQMQLLQNELGRLEAGLAWVAVLEQVVVLSESVLSTDAHRPSPLAALPQYTELYNVVERMQATLPRDMALLRVIVDVRERTWQGLKDIMSENLLRASEPLKWPMKVQYTTTPPSQRRAFERAFQDLLYLQAEGENLHGFPVRIPEWSSVEGLYPLQALAQPIALRFKYHFEGSKNTNRVDKPEWAFANILDQIFEHRTFVGEYLQPLVHRSGYQHVDVKSEFTMLLLPIPLGLLKARIPRLLDHPALLAHTIYQTVVFDDAIREGGFDINAVSLHEGTENLPWEGLAGVVLRGEYGWYHQWLAGERRFAESQLEQMVSSPDAWTITEETSDGDQGSTELGLKASTSARQVKSLIEQITDRYSPLPALDYKLPFVETIQLPLLSTYLSRISSSLDAFESLSSAFVRAVPGALAGNTRTGIHFDQARLTGGSAGLERLLKANVSAAWMLESLRRWADDVFFVEMSKDLLDTPSLRWKIQFDHLIPPNFKSGDPQDVPASVFDVVIKRYAALATRAEDMLVRHVYAEVEGDLRQHLQRRWDQSSPDEALEPDSSLLNGITALSSHLSALCSTLPSTTTSRLYRGIVSHLANHIQQRAVYAGWSKFTPVGGLDFSEEIGDWIGACSSALAGGVPGDQTAIEMPWRRLRDIGAVLRLPLDSREGSPTFSQAMAVAWGGEEAFSISKERLGLGEFSQAELQGVLKRRVECWR